MIFRHFYLLKLDRLLLVIIILTSTITTWSQSAPVREEEVIEEAYQESDENETFSAVVPDTPALRSVPDSVPEQLKREEGFAYANDSSFWVKKNQHPGFWDQVFRFFQSTRVKNVLYILVILLILFIVYRLVVVNNLFVFYNSKKYKSEDEISEDLMTDDTIREKINEAVRNGEYRLAIRLLYIETLQGLDQRQLIRYQADATNQEYVQQMNRTGKGKQFRQLTRVFDYVWYGKFPVSQEKFEIIQRSFTEFNQSTGI